MIIRTAAGAAWHVEDARKKLSCRARLPGARVFDLATAGLRRAKALGMSLEERLPMALPASWLVNSPAISRVLRRWALPPARETWVALLEVLDKGDVALLRGAVEKWTTELGDEPYLVEAMSKVAALLVPDAVPLMPPKARAFVLGEGVPADGAAFVSMVAWFGEATRLHDAELAVLAKAHVEVPISGAQALDRLLWVDSDGYQHFAEDGVRAPTITLNP